MGINACADVNICLQPKSHYFENVLTAHGYSHDWSESSVTNFTDNLLENIEPSSEIQYGFYWSDESTRAGVLSDYSQTILGPHYLLHDGNLWDANIDFVGDVIVDQTGKLIDAGVETVEQLTERAVETGKIIKIVALNTYSTVSDSTDVIVDIAGHAVYNSTEGFLNLIHSSTAVLGVFINDNLTYHLSSDQSTEDKMKMTPWINVEDYAGETITLSLRLSNPSEETEGKLRIDDLLLAKIEDTTVIRGDINSDGTVDLYDHLITLKVLSGSDVPIKIYLDSDTDENDKIDMHDAIYILRQAAGL